MLTFIKKTIKIFLRLKIKNQLEILKERGLKVGKNFKILEECIIDDSHCWHIEIGNDVTLAPRVHILAHDASTKTHLNYTKIKNVKIGDRVFIGAGSIILPGTTIGNDVIVGAGSIVGGKVDGNTVIAGNPAKFICHTSDYLNKMKSQMNEKNTFGEEYTLRQNVDAAKKEEMQLAVEHAGIGFVY
jgi:maltose O-acetyltransferase